MWSAIKTSEEDKGNTDPPVPTPDQRPSHLHKGPVYIWTPQVHGHLGSTTLIEAWEILGVVVNPREKASFWDPTVRIRNLTFGARYGVAYM